MARWFASRRIITADFIRLFNMGVPTQVNHMRPKVPPPVNSEPPKGRNRELRFWRFFWLTFLVVSLAYAWYCFYVPANGIAWSDNFAAAQQQSAESGKPTILYFTGKWCSPCRVMKRQVWADDEVKTLVNSQFIPVAIDVSDPDDAEVLARYAVGGAPVTIITDPQGIALRWRAGGISKSEFLDFLMTPDPSVENH